MLKKWKNFSAKDANVLSNNRYVMKLDSVSQITNFRLFVIELYLAAHIIHETEISGHHYNCNILNDHLKFSATKKKESKTS